MKLMTTAAILFLGATPLMAGDAANGEKVFGKCKSCHKIEEGQGRATGPNLLGVIGRTAGSFDGFKYSKGLAAVGETGLVWTEELVAEFVQDPNKFLDTHGGSGRSKMSFKLKGDTDAADVAAYLAVAQPK